MTAMRKWFAVTLLLAAMLLRQGQGAFQSEARHR